jgi:hypothetical protein
VVGVLVPHVDILQKGCNTRPFVGAPVSQGAPARRQITRADTPRGSLGSVGATIDIRSTLPST